MNRLSAPALQCAILFLATLAACLGSARPLWAQDAPFRIITEESPPASFYRNGLLSGLSVEIVREMQRELDDATQIEVLPWARGYRELFTKPNVLLFSTTRTPSREELFHWIGPLFSIRWILCGLTDAACDIKTLDDARKVPRIGVYREDVRGQFLKEQGFANLDVTDDQCLNIKKLLRKRVDLIVLSDIGLRQGFKNGIIPKDRIKPVFTLHTVDLYLAFSKHSAPALVRAWREAFERLRARGAVERIRRKWM